MTAHIGSQVSLQDLERRIAEREAGIAERERLTPELEALADFVRTASDELTRATEKLAAGVAERASWIRALTSVAVRPASSDRPSGSSVWSFHLEAVAKRSTTCSETLQAWARTEEKVSKALVRLHELKQRQTALPEASDPVLAELRQRRDDLRAQLIAKARKGSPNETDPGVDRAMTIKRKNGKVEEHDRFDWSDLPEYHGESLPGGAVLGRGCLNCGAPLPEGRKRFCSRGCHHGYMELYGSAAIPKSVDAD